MFEKGSQFLDWLMLDKLAIIRGISGSIPDSVWNAFLQEMEDQSTKYILALGAASLTATQRRAAAEVMKKLDITAVVVTDSALTRGIVTAVSWLGGKTKSFSWENLDAAVKFFGLSHTIEAKAKTVALEFKAYFDKLGKND